MKETLQKMEAYNFFLAFTLGVVSMAVFRSSFLRNIFKSPKLKKSFISGQRYKLVIATRSDLGMGKGKVAAQCGHATLGCYMYASKHTPEYLENWLNCGQPKIVLKLDPSESEASLMKLSSEARKRGIAGKVIHDAGHTQVASGTATVVGIGPGPDELVDEVTGHLKLL